MPDISILPMTRALCRQYYNGFESDPDIYMDMGKFHPFAYTDACADAYFDRQIEKKRLFFAIMEKGVPVGELLLKDVDLAKAECTLSIHLKNDKIKGRGVGTAAEKWMLRYAFETLHMNAVLADTVLKNTRSQHVLEKVGFRFLREDEMLRYYVIYRKDYANRQ